MRASFPAQALATLFAAVAVGTLGTGCSLGVDPLLLEEEQAPLPPPLLELETPLPELVYGVADDEDPELPGLQLTVRVRVNDLENEVWLSDIALGARAPGMREPLHDAPVHEDWRGRRCAELPMEFLPGAEPQRVTILANAGEGLGELRADILIGALE